MKEKKISLGMLVCILIICILIIIFAVVYCFNNKGKKTEVAQAKELNAELKNYENIDNKKAKYQVIYIGNTEIAGNGNYIIKDIQKYNEFIEQLSSCIEYKEQSENLSKYNEEYFKNNSLAIGFINSNNSAEELEVIGTEEIQNNMYIDYYFMDTDNTGMDVLGTNILMVEVNKNIKNVNLRECEIVPCDDD